MQSTQNPVFVPRRSARLQGAQAGGPTSAPTSITQETITVAPPSSRPYAVSYTPMNNNENGFMADDNAFGMQGVAQNSLQQPVTNQSAPQLSATAAPSQDFFYLDAATEFRDSNGNIYRIIGNGLNNNGQMQGQFHTPQQNMAPLVQHHHMQQPIVNSSMGTMNLIPGQQAQHAQFAINTPQTTTMDANAPESSNGYPNQHLIPANWQNPNHHPSMPYNGFQGISGTVTSIQNHHGLPTEDSVTSENHHNLPGQMQDYWGAGSFENNVTAPPEGTTDPNDDTVDSDPMDWLDFPMDDAFFDQEWEIAPDNMNTDEPVYAETPAHGTWMSGALPVDQPNTHTQDQAEVVLDVPMGTDLWPSDMPNGHDEGLAHNAQPSPLFSEPPGQGRQVHRQNVERRQDVSFAALLVNSIYQQRFDHATSLLLDGTKGEEEGQDSEDYDDPELYDSSADEDGKKRKPRKHTGARPHHPEFKLMKIEESWSLRKKQEAMAENDRRSREFRKMQKERNNDIAKRNRRMKVVSIWSLLGRVDDLNEEVAELRKQVLENWEGIGDDRPEVRAGIIACREERQKAEKIKQDEEDLQAGKKFGRTRLPKELFELVMLKKRGTNREEQEFAIEKEGNDPEKQRDELIELGRWQKRREQKVKADKRRDRRRAIRYLQQKRKHGVDEDPDA